MRLRRGRTGAGGPGAVVVCLLLSACGGGADANAPGGGPLPPLRGADVSALERVEQAGAGFRDAGQPGDAIAILRAHGSNLFRLRLFVSPNGQEVQVNDLDYTVRLAARIQAAGARLLLDLHYSDTWADPGHQVTPAAWDSLDIDTLEVQVEGYTALVMDRLRQAGIVPAIVQVGNEVDDGMLWPLGRISGTLPDTVAGWVNFTRLLQAGIRGVRAGLTPADTVRVLVHYSNGGSTGGTRWFFDHLEAYGVSYDLIGLSYYPMWHGPLADLRANLQATAARYGRDILVVETAYPWRAGGWEGMGPNRADMTWRITRGGQAAFLQDVLETVAATAGGRGIGVLWWYPEAILVPGLFIWGGGSLALFDAGGNALPALSEFDADAALALP